MSKLDPQMVQKLQWQVAHGGEADRILESEVFSAAITAPEMTVLRKWARSKPEEKQLREDCYWEQRAYAKVRRNLTNLSAQGKTARETLEREEE